MLLIGIPLPCLAAAPPSSDTLTLDDALARAVQSSEAARAARAGAAGAAQAARAAGQLPDPVLSVGIDNLPVQGRDRFDTRADFMTMKRIGISQEWRSPDKRRVREAAAQALASREALMAQTAAGQARLATALAYLDAYYARQMLALATLAEHHLREEVVAATARLASSTASSQEVLALTGARGLAEDDAAQQRQTEAAARVALQRWVGSLPPDAVLAAPAWPSDGAEPDHAERAYLDHHPAVLAAQADIALAHQALAMATANRRPDWTWQVSYGQRTGYADMVAFGVSIPLPVSPAERQDRETASRLAGVAQAEASLADALRAATAEYRSLASDAQRLAERIARWRGAVLAPAQQRTQAALAGYRANQASLASVFEARHAEVEQQRKLLALQLELDRTRAQLVYKPLPGETP